MLNRKIQMYSITHRRVKFVENTNYNLVNVGKSHISERYLNCDVGDNIIDKEKFYSELTFHYWFWKNKLAEHNDQWIGFCQRRRFWTKSRIKKKNINSDFVKSNLLEIIPEELNNYDSFLCEKTFVNNIKKIKMLKKGIRSILTKPSIFFNSKKQSLKFQFEMQHGYNIIDKAIELLDPEDKYDFKLFMEREVSFNAHNMFITKPQFLKKWYENVFKWLGKCEEVLGFNFKNYETRIYAYLSERYISYWFNKYTNCKELPWIFYDEEIGRDGRAG